jgi:hypothetical protein
MRRLLAATAFFLPLSSGLWVAAGVPMQRSKPDMGELLNHAGDYVERLRSQTLTCGEVYESREVNRNERMMRERSRKLTSEAVFTWVEELSTWLTVRLVRQVDGKPMDVQRDRLLNAVAATGPARSSRLQALADEGSRYILSTPDARLSDAMLTLQILLPANRARFQFTPRSDEKISRRAVRRVDFVERGTPTILQDNVERDVTKRGTVWLDGEDGSVARTNLTLELPGQIPGQRVRSSITVNYEPHPGLGMWVPASMQERHQTSRTTETVNAAVYSDCHPYVAAR